MIPRTQTQVNKPGEDWWLSVNTRVPCGRPAVADSEVAQRVKQAFGIPGGRVILSLPDKDHSMAARGTMRFVKTAAV